MSPLDPAARYRRSETQGKKGKNVCDPNSPLREALAALTMAMTMKKKGTCSKESRQHRLPQVARGIIYRLLILGGLQDFSASTRSENESSDANVYDKVPTFYGYHEGESDSLAVQLGPLLGVVLASIFGAIHCIAWSSPRPTTLETQLWRILSLIVTFAPLLFVVAFVLISMPRSYSGLIPTSFGLFQGRFLTPIAVPVYIAARCMLLGLALAQLRELPPRAHETVEWSRFLPHIQ
ncbi:hypothetical protein CC1G_14352 [Coprinopsis cinerea okayama7|uniref:Uncharacterized protein n=1 Tax=Coprinopsis cinerea (strain Okayama-7 / 130 / ATCC MYA-4618 / FGSC 9003) TaxID=240176 RepID=D6RM01_COPC7|nr:hypothetical protein CC1G_14352 [Coprinopsis cinerea okayama7\|eukprot:XP_002911353.1 hypothetical protein CC1G_14352 [Coprinopsis cinerea okayama7\